MMRTKQILVAIFIVISISACQTQPKINPEEIGNIERGREIFENGGGIFMVECAHCHSLDGTIVREISPAPSLQGIGERAGQRVEGLGAVEYLRQSITDPRAYLVEGFKDKMGTYKYKLTEQDVNDLVAFLLTR